MPSLKDIRRRIVTVQKTQQITRAMRMVSAAKLRRAQAAIESARPYADRMRATLEEVAQTQLDVVHPLLQPRDPVRRVDLVLVTSDRGLAGAFNAGVQKYAESMVRERERSVESVSLTLVGRKGSEFFRRRRAGQILERREIGRAVHYSDAVEVGGRLAQRFESGETDEVLLVYSEFVSTLTQRPRHVRLLPFSAAKKGDEGVSGLPYRIEPSPEALLATLVPKAVEVELYRALLESQAGEHAARMTAMESATRNTEELIDKLTLEFNRARQAAITKELMEIVSGAEAL